MNKNYCISWLDFRQLIVQGYLTYDRSDIDNMNRKDKHKTLIATPKAFIFLESYFSGKRTEETIKITKQNLYLFVIFSLIAIFLAILSFLFNLLIA